VIKNKILKIAKWLWAVAVVVFVGVYFFQHLPEEIEYLNTIRIPNVIFSVLLLVLGKLAVVELARQSVKRGNWTPSYLQMFSIVTISQLGKYIPGGIWHFAARINSYKENSLSNKKTAKVMILENIWLVSGAIVFAFFMLTLQPPTNLIYSLTKFYISPTFWLILRVALPLLWVIGLVILEKLFPVEGHSNPVKRILILLLVQTVIWAAMGSSFFLVFQEIGLENYWLILGGYTLSWVAGYIVIFAPGGIGVREFVLVALFAGLLPTGQIAIYSVVHRLIYTFVEVGLGGIGFLLQKLSPAEIRIETE
jgi:uncharacterized membrane protein YbhN (UPF0104 family)